MDAFIDFFDQATLESIWQNALMASGIGVATALLVLVTSQLRARPLRPGGFLLGISLFVYVVAGTAGAFTEMAKIDAAATTVTERSTMERALERTANPGSTTGGEVSGADTTGGDEGTAEGVDAAAPEVAAGTTTEEGLVDVEEEPAPQPKKPKRRRAPRRRPRPAPAEPGDTSAEPGRAPEPVDAPSPGDTGPKPAEPEPRGTPTPAPPPDEPTPEKPEDKPGDSGS